MKFASFDDYWAPYVVKDGAGAEYVAGLTDTNRTRLHDAADWRTLVANAMAPVRMPPWPVQ